MPYFGERVKLFVELEDIDANITGSTSEEKSVFSVPHPGKIKGYYEDTYISFIKTYPVYPQISDDYTDINYGEGELEIEHKGFIDINNQAIYGIWSIHETFTHPETGEEFPNISQGTWFLKKES